MSGIVSEAISTWRECRAAFEDYRAAEYEKAAAACRDRLVNREGRRRGVDAYSLFMGNRAHAYAWASEELVDYWETHTRPTYQEFEFQWWATRKAEEHYG